MLTRLRQFVDMGFSPLLLLLFAFLFPVSSVSLLPHTNETSERGKIETTKVISAITGDSDPDKSIPKKTFTELKTYAVLKNDLKGSLPADFTICSTIFTTKQDGHFLLTLLGQNEDIFLKTFTFNAGLVNTSVIGLSIQDAEYHVDDSRIPKVFPDRSKVVSHSQRNQVLSRWLLMES